MDSAAAESYRSSLVESGAAEEILRILVALSEEKKPEADAVGYLTSQFGQGTMPPFAKALPGHDLANAAASYEIVQENARLKQKHAELLDQFKKASAALKDALPEGTLQLSNLSAANVPDADVTGGISDPYLTILVLDVPNLDDDDDESTARPILRHMPPLEANAFGEKHSIMARTTVKGNSAHPVWEGEEFTLTLPAGTPRPPSILVRLWDDDVTKPDEPLAEAELQLDEDGGKVEKLVLKPCAGGALAEAAAAAQASAAEGEGEEGGEGGTPDITVSFDCVVALAPEAAPAEEGQDVS